MTPNLLRTTAKESVAIVPASGLYRLLVDDMLPLWSTRGLNPETGLSWEDLSFDLRPNRDHQIRLRVQARQAYCFAKATSLVGAPEGLKAKAQRLFDWIIHEGFDEAGRLAATHNAEGHCIDHPNDLYDLAFVLLAASAQIRCGLQTSAILEPIYAALKTLESGRGWRDSGESSVIRRQNPHMHLFEAALGIFEVTGDQYAQQIADSCLSLFLDVFLQDDGRVFELFDADWAPVNGFQRSEPGHIAEWIWLIFRYESLTAQTVGLPVEKMWRQITRSLTQLGLVPDTSRRNTRTTRLWCQTEYIRAAAVSANRGVISREVVWRGLDALTSTYLAAPTVPKGGWLDRCSVDGATASATMPASTLYHLQGMILALRQLGYV